MFSWFLLQEKVQPLVFFIYLVLVACLERERAGGEARASEGEEDEKKNRLLLCFLLLSSENESSSEARASKGKRW